MKRVDRLTNAGKPSNECVDRKPHNWQPLSFVFESQLLDDSGRVVIRQPSTTEGRVYCVCMGCHSHTYIVTEWSGYYLAGPDLDDAGLYERTDTP